MRRFGSLGRRAQRAFTLVELLLVVIIVFAASGQMLHAGGPFELQIQGASAAGGDAATVRGRLGADIQFSATGRARSFVAFFDEWGYFLDGYELQFLANDRSVFRTRPTVRLPDGQTRCWPQLDRSFGPIINGGFIVIFAENGTLMDIDQVILR